MVKGNNGGNKWGTHATTAKRHYLIIPNLIAAHALTECGTAARMNGIGKVTAINQLNNCSEIKLFGEIKSKIYDVLSEMTNFIAI